MKIKSVIFIINAWLIIFTTIFPIYGEWIEPKEIIKLNWGSGINHVGFLSEDTSDNFPQDLMTSSKNDIILWDMVNERIMVFSNAGKLRNIIIPEQKIGLIPKLRWGINSNTNIILKTGANYRVYNIKGELIKKFEGVETFIDIFKVLPDNSIIVLKSDENKYYRYSPTGQLLKTYDNRPLELGVVNRQSIGGGNYEATIEYPDKKWKVKGPCMKYIRDACGILYCVDNAIVIRYDDEGKDVAFIGMPDEKSEETPEPLNLPPGIDIPVSILEQYGSPVLAPNGDVYTWKRTPDKYSIMKWVWVDGPECPQYLEVTPTKNSLKFTWQKPTKDADKVTYYQLLQSYNICGPFRQTALLKKDQLSYEDRDVKKGETYYYVVKAVRGKDYSGNSNKVCGQVE